MLWGLYFGLLLTIEKFGLLRRLQKAPRVIAHLYTLFFVVLGWVLFDFTRLSDMGAYFANLFTLQNGLLTSDGLALLVSHLPLFIFAVVFSAPTARKAFEKCKSHRVYRALEPALGLAALVLCVASLVSSTYNPFLYFRF